MAPGVLAAAFDGFASVVGPQPGTSLGWLTQFGEELRHQALGLGPPYPAVEASWGQGKDLRIKDDQFKWLVILGR